MSRGANVSADKVSEGLRAVALLHVTRYSPRAQRPSLAAGCLVAARSRGLVGAARDQRTWNKLAEAGDTTVVAEGVTTRRHEELVSRAE